MQKKTDFTLTENDSLSFKTMIIHDIPSTKVLKHLAVIQRSYPIGNDAKGKPLTTLRPYRQLNVELLVYDKKEFTIVYNARLKIHAFYEVGSEDVEIHDTRIEIDKDTVGSVKEQIMCELRLHKKFIDDKFTGLVVPWSTISVSVGCDDL
jgi:hypothetical protein